MAKFKFQIKQLEEMPVADFVLLPAPAGIGASLVKSADGEITVHIDKV